MKPNKLKKKGAKERAYGREWKKQTIQTKSGVW